MKVVFEPTEANFDFVVDVGPSVRRFVDGGVRCRAAAASLCRRLLPRCRLMPAAADAGTRRATAPASLHYTALLYYMKLFIVAPFQLPCGQYVAGGGCRKRGG